MLFSSNLYDFDQTVKKAVELLESGEAFPKAPVSVEPQKEEKKDGKKNTTHPSLSDRAI